MNIKNIPSCEVNNLHNLVYKVSTLHLTRCIHVYPFINSNNIYIYFVCCNCIIIFCHDLQVERKRHIGNDIVNIVFWDGDPNTAPSFKPSMMKTRFTRILSFLNVP